jgi:hypothetical protein
VVLRFPGVYHLEAHSHIKEKIKGGLVHADSFKKTSNNCRFADFHGGLKESDANRV